jgi:hypothetical protein
MITRVSNPSYDIMFLLTVCDDKTDGELPALCSDKAIKSHSLASSVRMVFSEYGLQFARSDTIHKDAAIFVVVWSYGVSASGSNFT